MEDYNEPGPLGSAPGRSMVERMIGAARLRPEVFEEVEADTSATRQALRVVVMVAVATGIGTLGIGGIFGLFIGVIAGIVNWAFLAWFTHLVGTIIFRTPETHADWGQLARTLGFAQSPGMLKVFLFIPVLGPLIFLLAAIWQLVAMVIAVRQALDYTSTLRALGVVVVGSIPQILLFAFLSSSV